MTLTIFIYFLLALLTIGLVADILFGRQKALRQESEGDAGAQPTGSGSVEDVGGAMGRDAQETVDKSSRRDQDAETLHPGEPIRVFISSPVSSLSEGESLSIRLLSDQIATRLRGLGFETLVPVARVGDDVFSSIREQLAKADALLVLGSQKSNQAMGVQMAYASQSLIPTAMLRDADDELNRPLVLDAFSETNILRYRTPEEALATVGDWLERTSNEFRSKRELRMRAWREIEPLRVSLLEAHQRGALSAPGDSVLSQRLDFILSEPATFAAAPISEINAVSRLLGMDASDFIEHRASDDTGRHITELEWSALVRAAVVSDWSPLEINALVERRISGPEIEVKGAARAARTTPEDWMRFYNAHIAANAPQP